MYRHVSQGFTLIELMISISILAIISGIAIPSFSTLIENNRAQNQTDDFYTALVFARSEAVKRNQPVVLCKSSDQATCTTSNHWEQGYLVYVDENNNGNLDSGTGEPILQAKASLPANITLRAPAGSAFNNSITFRSDGSTFVSANLNLCVGSDITQGTMFVINATGRARMTEGASTCP